MTNSAPDRGRIAAIAVLSVTVIYHLALLFAQVRNPFPFLNDSVLHFGLMQSIVNAPERGQSILDPWVSTWCLGFPAFHYYQNVPHLLVIGLWKLTFGSLSLVTTFKIVEWLAIGTFPIPVYLGMRALGLARTSAVAAGVLSLWIKTNYLHGHDFESYVWQGLGQYTQIMGGWIFPLAIGHGCASLRDGRGYARAAILLGLTFLCHLAIGYMAFIAVGLFALVTPREIPRRLIRLALVAGVSIAASLYVVVPVFSDFAYYNVSTLVPVWKYNSFGHGVIFPWLFRGELFDYARLPVVSLLVGIGFVVTALRARRENERLLLVMFVFFFALFLGRPTWGRLLDLMPLSKGFHFSRAIFVVHVTGVMMAGVAIGVVGRHLAARGRTGLIAGIALAMLVAAAPLVERTKYLRLNAALTVEAAQGYAKEGEQLERALAVAAEDRMGRVYAGQGRPGQGWGGNFMVGWVPVYAWFPIRGMDALGYLHHMWSLNADFHDRFDERDEAMYRAFNVRRMIVPVGQPTPPFAREIHREGRFRVLAIEGPGFVQIVDSPYAVTADKRKVSRVHRKWLQSELARLDLYPRVHLTEEGDVPDDAIEASGIDFRFPPVKPAAQAPGVVLSVERTGDNFRARVRANRSCHVLLKMTYHPGWKVTVDGTATDAVHVLPSYLAVEVGPGEHEVHFRWDPGRGKLILLLLGLLPITALVLTERRLPI